eukprot:sb/3463081/
MFFTRYEADEEGGEQKTDLAAARLELLKKRIAAKQQSQVKPPAKQQNKIQPPAKQQNKIQPPAKQQSPPLISTPEVNQQNGEEKKKRKRKKRDIAVAAEEETVAAPVPEEAAVPKRKKKRKVEEVVLEANEVEPVKETEGEEKLEVAEGEKETKKKKKKKKEQTEAPEEVPEVSENDDERKKRKKKDIAKEEEVPVVNEISEQVQDATEVVKENEPSVQEQDPAPTQEENTALPEPTDQWIVLGGKKQKSRQVAVKRDLPDWIAESHVIDPDFGRSVPLEDFGGLLSEGVRGVLTGMEVTSLFPVQSEVIPDILRGSASLSRAQDLCVCGPTGSGKTLVYAISLAQILQKCAPSLQAIVVVPTKNLAHQVKQVFTNFSAQIKVALLSGKNSVAQEQKALYTESGTCLVHVAIATPGRLVNHLRDTPALSLAQLRYLVIDEVDSLLNQAYQDWLPMMLERVVSSPATVASNSGTQPIVNTKRYTSSSTSLSSLRSPPLPLQKLLFSATITHNPAKLAPLQLHRPVMYNCGGKYTLPSTLQQHVVRCKLEDKALVLIHLVQQLKHVLCFTGSVDTAHRLALLAEEFPDITVSEFSSSLSLPQRSRVVRDFASNKTNL